MTTDKHVLIGKRAVIWNMIRAGRASWRIDLIGNCGDLLAWDVAYTEATAHQIASDWAGENVTHPASTLV